MVILHLLQYGLLTEILLLVAGPSTQATVKSTVAGEGSNDSPPTVLSPNDVWPKIIERAVYSSNFKAFHELYEKCNLFVVRRRNVTEMVNSMAFNMNRAIMKKLKAIENLVKVAEKSYVYYTSNRFQPNSSDPKVYFNSKKLNLCPEPSTNATNGKLNTTREPEQQSSTDSSVDEGAAEQNGTSQCLVMKKIRHFMDLKVNLTYSTVHVPTIIYEQSKEILNSAAWSFHLNKAFMENYQNDPEITWQYFCGATGLYRTWPGTEWTYPENMPPDKIVDLFDCRVRTWYVKATSSPRDVIILIDSSGSMTGIKRSIAVQTVETILDTLSDDDFVNILSFNNQVKYVDSCFNQGLVQATVENRKHLRDAIEDLPTNDIAQFSDALETAFLILNDARTNISRTEKVNCICQSHYTGKPWSSAEAKCQKRAEVPVNNKPFLDSSACNKMIMLVTDGASETAQKVFKKYNWSPDYVTTCHPKETRVFTYLIGRELGDERAVRWMACANKGLHAHVSTLEDIQDNIQDYIPVIARPIAISGDHVTVWSSVFLDIEKHIPLKEYKWYPYRLKNKAIPMDLFKSTTKQYHLMISVAQPAFDKLQNQSHVGGLLGAVAVDIPVRLLREFAPIHRLGVHGYSFLINHNGYVIYHPDLRPVLGEYRKRNYNSIDIDALELPADVDDYIYPLPDSPIQQLRRDMIMGLSGRRDAIVKRAFDDMRRAEVFQNSYYFSTLGDKDSNPFSLGIALRMPYGKYEVVTEGLTRDIIKTAITFSSWPQLNFSNWVYCNSTIENKVENQHQPVLYYLQEKLIDSSLKSCTTNSNKQLINRVIVDLYLMSTFDKSFRKTGEDSLPFGQVEDITFIATSSGIMAYWCRQDCTDKQKSIAKHFQSENPSTIESVYYERTVNFTFEQLKSEDTGDRLKLRKDFLFSLLYVPYLSNGIPDHDRYVVATNTIWLYSGGKRRVPIAVLGAIMNHSQIFQHEFLDKLPEYCNSKTDSYRTHCYVLDEHGYVFAQPGSLDEDHVGKFFGDVSGILMNDMIERGLYGRIRVFDFQSVCVKSKTKSIKAFASTSYTSIFRLETYFSFIRLTLAFLILLLQQIAAAAQQSLTEILPTHIDFQKPQMYYNSSQPTSKLFEACIETQQLYLASKQMKKGATTFQVDCPLSNEEYSDNPPNNKIMYTIQPLQGSNLFFVNYSVNSGSCFSHARFNIRKTPIDLSEEKKCIRLKTTPYRERPQKCYFVSDRESETVCWGLSGSARPSFMHMHLSTFALWCVILWWWL